MGFLLRSLPIRSARSALQTYSARRSSPPERTACRTVDREIREMPPAPTTIQPRTLQSPRPGADAPKARPAGCTAPAPPSGKCCLLYTSDAADEEDSVD